MGECWGGGDWVFLREGRGGFSLPVERAAEVATALTPPALLTPACPALGRDRGRVAGERIA
jgi:hypothetical protein